MKAVLKKLADLTLEIPRLRNAVAILALLTASVLGYWVTGWLVFQVTGFLAFIAMLVFCAAFVAVIIGAVVVLVWCIFQPLN